MFRAKTAPLEVFGRRCASEQIDSLSLRLNHNTGDGKQALGRSRGGFSNKIVGVCDAAGRLVDFVLVPGQAHELAPRCSC